MPLIRIICLIDNQWYEYMLFIFVSLILDLWCQISLGDVQSNYLLTTAENELGVVVAHSEAGKCHCSGKQSFCTLNGSILFEHKVAQE